MVLISPPSLGGRRFRPGRARRPARRAFSAGQPCLPRRCAYVQATALNARSAVSVGSSSPSGSDPSCAPSRRKWTNGSRYDAGPPGAAWWKASSVARSSGRWRSMTSHSASSPRANRSRPEPRTVRTGYIVERKSSASAPRRASTRASRPSPWRQSVERARPEASATRSSVRPSQPCSPSTWIAALRTRSSSRIATASVMQHYCCINRVATSSSAGCGGGPLLATGRLSTTSRTRTARTHA